MEVTDNISNNQIQMDKSSKQVNFCIAGLTLQLFLPTDFDVDLNLPSFKPFVTDIESENEIVCKVVVGDKPIDYSLEDLKLLSDASIFWEDRFKFYEWKTGYLTLVNSEDHSSSWKMFCSKTFEDAYIERGNLEVFKENVIGWLLMVVFAQAGLLKSTILMHASVVEDGESAYAFLGKSGTGKSTHSKLWLKYISGFRLLNDDNPAVRLMPNGRVHVFGTPWSGKTNCYRNIERKLKAFVRLNQSKSNNFLWQENKEKLITLLPSCSAIRWNSQIFSAMTTILVSIANTVPVGTLDCLPDEDAAKLSYLNVISQKN